MSRGYATFSTESKRAFVLKSEEVKRGIEAAKRFAEGVKLKAECSDELHREFDFKALEEFQNAPDKAIDVLTILASHPEDERRGAKIIFRAKGPFTIMAPV